MWVFQYTHLYTLTRNSLSLLWEMVLVCIIWSIESFINVEVVTNTHGQELGMR